MTNQYVDYYTRQAGGNVGPVFVGSPYQRGHGIGNFLSSLFRTVFPLFKSGAKAVGKEALNAGFGVLRDQINRKPLKTSLKNRMRAAGDNLMTQAEAKIDTMSGAGYKRKRVTRRTQYKRKSSRRQVKRVKRDIFS